MGEAAAESADALTDAMRKATSEKKLHARDATLISRKMGIAVGNRTTTAHCLAQFQAVFQAFEDAITEIRNSGTAPGWASEVLLTIHCSRGPGLASDLKLIDPDYKPTLEKAAHEYLEHIASLKKQALAGDEVALAKLLQYVYHNHLATMGGGPIISKMIKRAMGFKEEMHFSKPPEGRDGKAMVAEYKAAWNKMGKVMPQHVREVAINESPQVFSWNNSVASSVDVSKAFYNWRTLSRVGYLYITVFTGCLTTLVGGAYYIYQSYYEPRVLTNI